MESEKDMFYRLFNNNLKDILDDKGFTYKEIAPVLGMSKGVFANKINNCNGKFTLYEVCKMTDFLKVSVSKVINYDKSTSRSSSTASCIY